MIACIQEQEHDEKIILACGYQFITKTINK